MGYEPSAMTHAEHSAGGQTIIGVTLALCVIACWVTTHITALFLGTTPTGMAAVMLVLLQCWLNVGLFIIAHDCMHGSLAPGWLRFNTGVGTLCLYLYAGFSYAKLCPEHYRHHANPGTADDPDFCVTHSTQVIPWYISFVRYYFG
ncbi:MAG: beta-carotene ketolase, partial [Chromatiales bacterium]|nr:beta-carotene ketolase [Chromatiales bacterium]